MTAPRRLLAGTRQDGRPLGLAEHVATHGPLPAPRRGDARDLQRRLTGAPLRGRGGAGFPAARKLATGWQAGKRGQLIANGAEGEPASLKDGTLLQLSPHLVLDGVQQAARSLAAREAVVAVHEGAACLPVLHQALQERRSVDTVPVRVLVVPPRYVAGEASALARAAGGGPSLPALHDQPLAERGLDRRPQVVLNVETLAGLALYLRHGPQWYGELGTADEPGTLLLTVRSSGTQAAVMEAPLGTPVRAALAGAGVAVDDVQAVLVGGYFGAWLAAPQVLDLPLTHAALRAAGGALGAGVVVALGRQECGLRATAEAARYLAGESAAQCGPCLNGLPALAGGLELLAAGEGSPELLERLDRWCRLVEGRGLCHHPDGVTVLVRSALAVFADDVAAHQRGGCGRPAGRALAVPRRVP